MIGFPRVEKRLSQNAKKMNYRLIKIWKFQNRHTVRVHSLWNWHILDNLMYDNLWKVNN